MGRLEKRGLSYFSHDTDMFFDTKMKYIRAKHKLLGYAIYNRLLEIIYSENGYYLDLSDEFIILLSDELRIELNELETIINDFLNRELFSKKKYEAHNILTSKRIQENYIRGCERRKSVYLTKEFLLINPETIFSEDAKIKPQIFIKGINEDINGINEDINSIDEGKSTQSKSKGKENETKANSKSDEKILPETIYPDLNLPFSTLLQDHSPKTFTDEQHVKNKIREVLVKCTGETISKGSPTTFYKIIMTNHLLPKSEAFKIFSECCFNYRNLDSTLKNFRYLNKQVKGKINDANIELIDKQNAELQKAKLREAAEDRSSEKKSASNNGSNGKTENEDLHIGPKFEGLVKSVFPQN
ncbi:MAG TPA: hypothetical protein DHV28_17670 [Ignavibacteriales bacterium]|nr:hypothetical protein [Ignavibacteriales bacterium]